MLVIVSIWWFSFSLVTFFLLGSHPCPPLPSLRAYITLPWTRLLATFRHIKELPDLGRFILIYFFYSDGYNVVGSVRQRSAPCSRTANPNPNHRDPRLTPACSWVCSSP